MRWMNRKGLQKKRQKNMKWKKRRCKNHKAEMIAMEKQVRGLEEDKKHLLQQKISKQEPSLIQGIRNACVSQFVITVCMPFYVFFY